MAEYIERDALLKSIANDVAPLNIAMVFRHIHNAPAADVAPVVHKNWAKIKSGRRGYYIFRCTACNACSPYVSKYCPDCGAKMDGGESKVVGTAD